MKTHEPGTARDIWLHLLKVGEWQGVGEIRIGLPGLSAANIPATLDDMRQSGAVAVRQVSKRKNLYAVTSTCRVARGVTVKELLAATTFKPEEVEG